MLDETFGFGFAFGLCVRCTATRIACNNSGVQPEGLCAEPSCLRSFSGMDVTLCPVACENIAQYHRSRFRVMRPSVKYGERDQHAGLRAVTDP